MGPRRAAHCETDSIVFPAINVLTIEPRQLAKNYRDNGIEAHRHHAQGQKACKHQINFHSATGQEHQIAKSLGLSDPLTDSGAYRCIYRRKSDAGKQGRGRSWHLDEKQLAPFRRSHRRGQIKI